MSQDTQPEFAWPPIVRLPQVPPLKVPARRQSQFIARPMQVRYTEQVPVAPPLAPENNLFLPVPITPPLTQQPQTWVRTPRPANQSMSGMAMREYIPVSRKSRDVGNGEFLLGCAFLILMGLLALGLLTWLSSAR